MKTTRLLITVLLLGMASLAEAQIVVSSTTASTTHVRAEKPKSERTRDLVIRPAIDLGVGVWEFPFVGVSGTIAYQFNPHYSIGGGFGFNSNFYYEGPMTWIPLRANARVYFCDRKWSPFLELLAGYNIPINKGVYRWDEGRVIETLTIEKLTAGFILGLQYKGFDFGVSVNYMNGHMVEESHYNNEPWIHDYYNENNKSYAYGTVFFGYNFPLTK